MEEQPVQSIQPASTPPAAAATTTATSTAAAVTAAAAPDERGGAGLVVRMRGLPFNITEQEVREFLGEFPVDEIVLVSQGFRRGEAYVVFSTPEAASGAISKLHRSRVGARYVELHRSLPPCLDAARAQMHYFEHDTGNIVRLRGLPFNITEQEVCAFLASAPLDDDAVTEMSLVTTADRFLTGEAFVRLATAEAKEAALRLDRKTIGSRYVELLESSAGERDFVLNVTSRTTRAGQRLRGGTLDGGFGLYSDSGSPHDASPLSAYDVAVASHASAFAAAGGRTDPASADAVAIAMFGHPPRAPPPEDLVPGQRAYPVVRIRGLPYSVDETAVADFLSGVGVPPQGVHLVYDANERPTGDAFVEVCSESDAQAALRMHRQMMGRRYIEVFASCQADMYRLQAGVAAAPHGHHAAWRGTGYAYGGGHQYPHHPHDHYVSQHMHYPQHVSTTFLVQQHHHHHHHQGFMNYYHPGYPMMWN